MLRRVVSILLTESLRRSVDRPPYHSVNVNSPETEYPVDPRNHITAVSARYVFTQYPDPTKSSFNKSLRSYSGFHMKNRYRDEPSIPILPKPKVNCAFDTVTYDDRIGSGVFFHLFEASTIVICRIHFPIWFSYFHIPANPTSLKQYCKRRKWVAVMSISGLLYCPCDYSLSALGDARISRRPPRVKVSIKPWAPNISCLSKPCTYSCIA